MSGSDVGTPTGLRAPLSVAPTLLVDALTALAAAEGTADVAAAALPLLLEQPGVRASAVVARSEGAAVVLASAGYDCGSMAAGTALPLDAGLPVTEAVRTGRPVERGDGPSWVALPFAGARRTGALLLSLVCAPPVAPDERARLHRLARALGDALQRAAGAERLGDDLALLTSGLAAARPATDASVVLRSTPHAGPVGGDVALVLPDERGGRWVLVADVCGSGLRAAVLAHAVTAAATAVAPYVDGPDALLSAVDRAVRPQVPPGSFVTAAACHLADGRLRVATAGHPAPWLLTGTARQLDVEPGQPLALETGPGPARATATADLPPGAVLLLHTDGLLDRRRGSGPRDAEVPGLLPALPADDLDAVADAVLAAADARGPAEDDVTLLLVRAG